MISQEPLPVSPAAKPSSLSCSAITPNSPKHRQKHPQILTSTDIPSVCISHNLSVHEFTQLQSRAVAAKATAYCPYSEFRVGATILTASGEYVDGANVENASYPVGTCAERVAFGKAVTEGYFAPTAGMNGGKEELDGTRTTNGGSKGGFRAVAVATDITPPASPCGMCRQFIREFCGLKTPIIMFDKNGDFIVKVLEELLPMSFGPEALPPPAGNVRNHDA